MNYFILFLTVFNIMFIRHFKLFSNFLNVLIHLLSIYNSRKRISKNRENFEFNRPADKYCVDFCQYYFGGN